MVRVLELYADQPQSKGGIDTYMRALVSLFKDDSDVEILPVEYLPVKGIPFLKYYYSNGTLDDVIVKFNPEWIHINGYTSWATVQSFLVAKRHKKKILYTAHWHPFSQLRHPFAGKLFFHSFIKPLVRRYANAVIAINNEDFSFFKEITNKVYRIPHWCSIDHANFLPVEKIKNMILFVGRVADPVKGIDHIYHLPEGKYKIHCVGSGEMNVRSDIQRHVNISSEELNKLYSEASLLVVPSKYEAFSYAALEALFNNTPVLASERVRIGDYLDGVDGFETFTYGDFENFVSKVQMTIGEKVDKVRIYNLFNPLDIKSKYKNILLDI